jgi:hypothetical protein
MEINGLALPSSLVADMTARRTKLSAAETAAFGAQLVHIERPSPELCGYEWMVRENKFWTTPDVEHYLGGRSQIHTPGDIDPRKAVIFGFAEPDGPVALDYRTDPPRVVYLGVAEDGSCWFDLAPTYDAFMASIRPPAKLA